MLKVKKHVERCVSPMKIAILDDDPMFVKELQQKIRECFKTIKVTKPKYRQVKQRHENRQPSFHTG